MPTWDNYISWITPVLCGEPSPTLAEDMKAKPPAPSQFVTDSRSIKSGEFFVPLVGENFDGHKFIGGSLEKGAAGFFFASSHKEALEAELSPEQMGLGVEVSDTLEAFQVLAKGYRNSLKELTLLALTGSSGKTTTKEMLGLILNEAGNSLATFGSFNNEIGVPKTLLSLLPAHRFAVLEFGARKMGDISFLVKMAQPDIGAVINVGRTHIEIFGSEENLLRTKLEMLTDSGPKMLGVHIEDDQRVKKLAEESGKKNVSFGYNNSSDIRVAEATTSEDGSTSLELSLGGESLKINIPMAHQSLPINAAAAAAMAHAAGIGASKIKLGLEKFCGLKGRYQITRTASATLIDDAYNASPESMAAGFNSLKDSFLGADAKRCTDPQKGVTLILGDMLELGAEAEGAHQATGLLASQLLNIAHLYVVGPLSVDIQNGAVEDGLDPARCTRFGSASELLTNLEEILSKSPVIYVKASHGIGLEAVVENIKCALELASSKNGGAL